MIGDHLHDGYLYEFVRDVGGTWRFTQLSAGAERVHGVAVDELLRDAGRVWRRIEPEDWASFEEAGRWSAERMEDFEATLRFRRENGELRVLSLRSHPILGERGEVRWEGLAMDVTERRRVADSLGVIESKYRSLFEMFPLGITVADRNGHVVESNRLAEDLLGISAEEHRRRDIAGEQWRIIRPDGTAMPSEEYASVRALKENRRVDGVEMGIVKPNGETTWIIVSAAPLSMGEGGVVITYGDITDRKRAEARVRQEAERTDLLLQLHRRAPTMSDRELYDYVLEKAVRLTASEIGFFHRVSEDQNTILLTTWNQAALKTCTAAFDANYPLREAGNWVDCVRQQRPVVYNDYEHSPNRHGLPAGHTPVRRFMSIPVVEDGKVRIIFGVGNKPSDYDEHDVAELQLVANELHKIMSQRVAEERVRQLSRAVEQSPVGVVILDRKGRILYVNPRFTEASGYTPEDVRGHPPWKLESDGTAEASQQGLRRALEIGVPWHGELPQRKKSGERVWESVSLSPIKDPTGEIGHFVMVREEVTEQRRVRSESAAREGVWRLFQQAPPLESIYQRLAETLVSNLGFPVALIELYDPAGRQMTLVGCCGLNGIPLGHRSPVDASLSGVVASSERAVCIAGLGRRSEGDFEMLQRLGIETFIGVPFHLGRNVAGTIAVADRIFRRDVDAWAGNMKTIAVSLSLEIDRRQAEEVSRKQRDLNLSLAATGDLNEGWRLCLAAAIEVTRFDCGGFYLVDERSGDLVLQAHQGLSEAFLRSISRFGPESPQARLVHAGRPVYSRCSDRLIPLSEEAIRCEGLKFLAVIPMNHEGRLVGCLNIASHAADGMALPQREALEAIAAGAVQAIVRMRTAEALRAKEAELRQAQKLEAIGQLAGGVAHDFNNILAATMMHLGLLQMNEDVDEETREGLRELEAEARRAASLTRQLLMFSRRSVLNLQSIDLNEVVANLLKMLSRLIGENVKLRFEGEAGLPGVLADVGMMEQVVMNLVVNARDALPKGGRVTIGTQSIRFPQDGPLVGERRPGRFACLTVSDNGRGMDAETMQRIFEPFFTTKEAGKGTGLGLATVHGIVAQHRGWVEVESRPDEGATFRVYLPVPESAAPTEAVRPKADTIRRGRESILVVEDDAQVRMSVVQALGAMGYRVRQASNGQEAVALWLTSSEGVDLLLTDMVMPEGMTGLELAERLQESRPGLKVIISSGYSAEIAQAGVPNKAGVVYLPKPYETRQLAEVVRNLLDRR